MWFTNLSWITFFSSSLKTRQIFSFPSLKWQRLAMPGPVVHIWQCYLEWLKSSRKFFSSGGGLFIALGLVQVKVSAGLLSKVSVSVLFLQHTPPVPSSFCHHNVQLCACDFSRKVRGVVFKFRCILKISIRISLNISTSVSATKIWYISHQPNIDKKISPVSLCHA